MSPWQVRDVPFNFQMSDWTLFQLNEGSLRYVDSTEGHSDRMVSVRATLRNAAIVRSHSLMDRFSGWAEGLLNRYVVKATVHRLIRKHG